MGYRKLVIQEERIDSRIFMIRGAGVMISTHLAELYEVEPRALLQAVKRNLKRFPEDFMFQLTAEEANLLKSQSIILKEKLEASLRSQIVILKKPSEPASR